MRVTLLGHASVLVEMTGATCLMDPVLFDPFEEGAVVSCPKREVFPERLPAVDTIVVSHRHPDHFDLRSLAALPRGADVIIPPDPLIAYALKKLGFSHVHAVHPMAPIQGAGFQLFPTRSEAPSVTEMGMVFKDAAGVFWNQVDTFLADATIDEVRRRFGGVDLLFAMYASQNFEYFENRSTAFPFEIHRRNLETALRIGAGTAAPGSAGFRFAGDHGWLNAFLFPIDRERFARDLAGLGFAGAVRIMNPGDVFEIATPRVEHLAGASPAARMVVDDTHLIRFDPTAPVPALRDPNPEGRAPEFLERSVDSFIDGLAAYATAGGAGADKVIDLYRRHRIRYGIEAVLPKLGGRWYAFAFATDGARVEAGLGPMPPADIAHRIAASALADWSARRRSFFYVRAYSRRHEAAYAASAADGGVRLRALPLPDLLMHYLLNVAEGSAEGAKRAVDLELKAIAAAGR